MSSFNKVLLMGRLTRDPELRVAPTGLQICKFAIAVSRSYRTADGQNKEEVLFIDIDAFGKQAEIIQKFFNKGKPIFVEGRLKMDQWESQAGEKRSKFTVVLEAFQFIGNKEAGTDGHLESNYEGSVSETVTSPPASTYSKNYSSTKPKVVAPVLSADKALAADTKIEDDIPF